MRATLLLLLFAAVAQVKAITLGFGEIDYQATESAGGRTFVIQKNDDSVSDLVVVVTTLLYSEVNLTNISEEFPDPLPDPAEYDPTGKQDFVMVEETLTFPPGTGLAEQTVFIPFKDDPINEEQEGFWVQVRVDEAKSDPKDVQNVKYDRDGLALAVINDDDEIRFTFERSEYTVSENAGQQNDLITVVKQDNVTTERTLTVLVQLNPLSGTGAATQGEDFELRSSISVTVSPDEQEFNIPFEVKQDSIAEDEESFSIFLSVPRDGNWLLGDISTAAVIISDDDVAVVGFERPEYTVNEGDTVEVCIVFFNPEAVDSDLFALGTVTSNDGDAEEGSDFVALEPVQFFIQGGQRTCYPILIIDDNETESTENFTISITPDPFTPPNVVLTNSTIIIVRDNDIVQAPSCDRCDPNADCIDIAEGENTCVCRAGYSGDGLTCTDIDECTLGIAGCSTNAMCRNTISRFECECNSGYNGDGFTCMDINECTLGTHMCSEDGVCINTQGGYRCQCNRGFTGDGFTCEDIDECALGSDRCSDRALCINIRGSYMCQCREGFEGNGIICNDVNECFKQLDKCSDNGWCTNTVGGYECTCREGFIGDGLTCTLPRAEPVTENEPTPCDDDDDDVQEDEETTNTRTRHTHTRTGSKSKKTKSKYTVHMAPDPENDENVPCDDDDDIQLDEENTPRSRSHTRTTKDGTSRTSGTRSGTQNTNGNVANDDQAALVPNESTRTKSKSSRRSNSTPRRNNNPASDEQAAPVSDESTKSKSKSPHHSPRRNEHRVYYEPAEAPSMASESHDSSKSKTKKSKRTKKGKHQRVANDDSGEQEEGTSRHSSRHSRRSHKSKQRKRG